MGTRPAAPATARPCWAWWHGSMRSPGSACATPGYSSPTSAPTCRCLTHPRPRRRVGPADLAHPPVREQRPAGAVRQGQPLPARRARPVRDGGGQDRSRLGEQYRRIARRRGKQKAIVAVSRAICEIACILISDPGTQVHRPRRRLLQPRGFPAPDSVPGSGNSSGSTPA